MGTSLNGTTPQNTYPSLIKVGDNGAVDATLQRLSDGEGNDLPLLISSTSVTNLGGGAASGCTAFGDSALLDNLTGTNNTAIGKSSLENNTASNNTAVGFEAGNTNTTGTGLTAIGYQALRAATGTNNTALGYQAGLSVTTTFNNTTIGASCSSGLTSGSNNTVVGSGGLFNITTGAANVALGVSTKVGASGSRNIVIGNDAGGTLVSECIILGTNATATANNQFVVGSATYNAGAVTAEVIVPDSSWTVRINGANYKIPMLAI